MVMFAASVEHLYMVKMNIGGLDSAGDGRITIRFVTQHERFFVCFATVALNSLCGMRRRNIAQQN